MYVRAVLDQAIAQDAILAPQQGISHDAKGNATAMVVGADGKVELRTLVADRAIGDRWLVDERPQGRRQADRRGPEQDRPGHAGARDRAGRRAGAGSGAAAASGRCGAGLGSPAAPGH